MLREIVSSFGPRYRAWAMACGPDTSSEIVGREAGATHMLARTPRAPDYARLSVASIKQRTTTQSLPKRQEGLVILSSPPLGQGVSRYDIRVVQSPSDCILRSVSPLCRLRSDVSGPPPLTPWVSVVARQTPPRPCLNQWVRMAEGRVSRLVRSPASLGSLSATREHHLAAEA